MAFMQISFYSKVLNMVTNMCAIIPEKANGVGVSRNEKKRDHGLAGPVSAPRRK